MLFTLGCLLSQQVQFDEPIDKVGDQRLLSYVTAFKASTTCPGVWIAVAHQGKFLGAAAVGYNDLELKRPAKLTDRVRYGSISKPVFGSIVAHFVQKEQILWTEKAFDALPNFAKEAHQDFAPITLEMLLTHRSGAPRDGRQPETNASTSVKDVQSLRQKSIWPAFSQKAVFSPGSKNEYSNIAFTVACMMLEQKTGRTYEQLIQEVARETWGLKSIGMGEPPTEFNTRAHLLVNGKVEAREKAIDWTYTYSPAGSIHSTIEDMCRFGLIHCATTKIRRSTLERIHDVVPPGSGTKSGFSRETTANGTYNLSHSGALSNRHRGDIAIMFIRPSSGTVVCAYTNLGIPPSVQGPLVVLDQLAKELVQPIFRDLTQ